MVRVSMPLSTHAHKHTHAHAYTISVSMCMFVQMCMSVQWGVKCVCKGLVLMRETLEI